MPMKGFVGNVDSTTEEVSRAQLLTPSDPDLVRFTAAAGGPMGSLTEGLVQGARQFADQWNDYGGYLQPEAANAQFGIEGVLRFDKPVTRSEAQWRRDNKREEIYRQAILDRDATVSQGERFAWGMAGGIVDPASLGLNLIPVFGEVKMTGAAAKAGLGTWMARGAWAGAQGGAWQTAAEASLAAYRGIEYTPEYGAMNILGGAVLGGALGGVGYAAGAPARRAAAASTAQAATIRGLLEARGVTGHYADGIMAGAHAESLLDPQAVNPTSGAYGIGQWLGSRKAALFKRYGNAPTLEQQIDFLVWELNGGDHGGASVLKGATAQDVARAYIVDFMRPAAGRETTGDLERAAAFLGGEVGMTPTTVATTPVAREAAPPPPVISAMDEIDRAGAAVKAIDDMQTGGRVDIGQMVESSVERPRARAVLDEGASDLQIRGRLLHDDVAVTVRGTEVPVRYAIVEARDLKASHDGDLIRNPDYPEELQPRDRDRAGSQARLLRMEQEFHPMRLIGDRAAESGAPIVSPDGVVESGNGRTILLARNAAKDTLVWSRYQQALQKAGYDLTGFEQPVLVRVRQQPMTGSERVRLSREMNADTAERYSATEQAFVDAAALSDDDVQMFQGGALTGRANDAFLRAFLTKAGAGQENALVDPATRRLSQTGIDRIQAATVARAFGDKGLVSAIFETSNPLIKAFGNALTEAAPIWAKMRGLAAKGELAEGADTTRYLVEALNFVRHVRDHKLNMADIVDKWADQVDMFADDALSIEAQEYLRLMFKDDAFKVQRAADKIAEDLKDIAEAAIRTTPAPDLFGTVSDFDVAAQISRLNSRRGNEEGIDVQSELGPRTGTAGDGGRLAGDSGEAGGADLPGLVSLARAQERPAAGEGGGAAGADGGQRGVTANDDPEIKELAEELARLEATEPEAFKDVPANENPDLLSEAVRAAEFCLREGGVK